MARALKSRCDDSEVAREIECLGCSELKVRALCLVVKKPQLGPVQTLARFLATQVQALPAARCNDPTVLGDHNGNAFVMAHQVRGCCSTLHCLARSLVALTVHHA